MNKYEVEKILPEAVDILEKYKKDEKKGKNIDSSTRSKLSAFGATILMSGLLPAAAAYSKDSNKIVTELVKELLDILLKKMMIVQLQDTKLNSYKSLFGFVKDNMENERKIEEAIIDCIIALKLALDSFEANEEIKTNG